MNTDSLTIERDYEPSSLHDLVEFIQGVFVGFYAGTLLLAAEAVVASVMERFHSHNDVWIVLFNGAMVLTFYLLVPPRNVLTHSFLTTLVFTVCGWICALHFQPDLGLVMLGTSSMIVVITTMAIARIERRRIRKEFAGRSS